MNVATDQWLQIQLKLRKDLVLQARLEKGKRVVVVEDKLNSKFFRLGYLESQVLSLMDGDRSISQANQMLGEINGFQSLPTSKLKELFDWLVRNNLVETGSAPHVDRFDKTARTKRRQRITQWFNPFFFRLPLFRPDAFLSRLLPFFGWMFSRWGLALWLVMMLIAGYELLGNWAQFKASSSGILSGYRWLWLAAAGVFLKVIHECGHGLACKRFGAQVREAGIVLMCFMPLAFIDVTSCWRLPNKWHRITISLGGMLAELLVAALAIIVWSRNPNSMLGDFCYNIAVMASFMTIVFNANPLMRFDGYYVLSDLFATPNMYQRAAQLVGKAVREFLLNLSAPRSIRWNLPTIALFLYGIATFVWRILICLGLVLLASFMFHGAGIVFAVAGLVLWTIKPITSTVRWLMKWKQFTSIRPLRAGIAVSVLLLCCIGIGMFLSRPATISAPGVVEFSPLTVIRASSDGFLSKIYVADGETVKAGQLIAELQNDELDVRLQRLQHELAQSQIQAMDYRHKNEFALAQAEDTNENSLREQILELEQKKSNLLVFAPLSGCIVRHGWDNLLGTHLAEGDEIVVLGDPDRKELRVSIDQADVVGLLGQVKLSAKAYLAGHKPIDVEIARIEPQASLMPLHASLCAGYGGSLSVKMRSAGQGPDQQKIELISPRFAAVSPLSPEISSQLLTGQRVIIRSQATEKTLAVKYYESCRSWLRHKIHIASQRSGS